MKRKRKIRELTGKNLQGRVIFVVVFFRTRKGGHHVPRTAKSVMPVNYQIVSLSVVLIERKLIRLMMLRRVVQIAESADAQFMN